METRQFDQKLSDNGNMLDIEDFKRFYNEFLLQEQKETNYDNEWKELLLAKSGKSAKEITFTILDNYDYANKLQIESDNIQYKNKYTISPDKAGYIVNEVPVKRIDMALLGLICGLSREEIDYCLQRYLKQSKLYARDVEDFIWIYLIEHRNLYETHQFLSVFYKTRAELKSRLLCEKPLNESIEAADTVEMNRLLKTSKAYIEYIDNEYVLKSFIEARASMIEQFDNMYDNQRRFEKSFLKFKYHTEGSGAYKKLNNTRNIIKKDRLPAKRHEIIAMCLHMNQDKDGINKFLDSCGMGRLLSKNIVESLIIFVSNYISDFCNYYSNGLISDDKPENGNFKFYDAEAIKSSWMWEYIVDSSDADCIENEESDFNLPVSVIRGIINKEFICKEYAELLKEEDLDIPDSCKYMINLYQLL